jgi:RNA polymerase sigma-70 factor (ECF subfamily)
MPIFSIFQKHEIKSDLELIHRYKSSDDYAALDALFQKYLHLMFLVCKKYLHDEADCKDAVMEIFEKSIQALKNYEITDFKNWLYTTTKNYCLYQLKQSGHQTSHKKNFERYESFFMENPDFSTLYSEKEVLFKKLEWAIERLKCPQKTCIDLFYFQRMSYQQIAATTGYSIKQVKSHIQNGKANLKKILSPNQGVDNEKK